MSRSSRPPKKYYSRRCSLSRRQESVEKACKHQVLEPGGESKAYMAVGRPLLHYRVSNLIQRVILVGATSTPGPESL